MRARHFDVLLVGGGLQSGLIALALLRRQPGIRVAIIERSTQPGGNHTWSFHDGDLPAGMREVVAPLVAARWPSQVVRFPTHMRKLDEAYAAITSDRLRDVVTLALGDALITGHATTRVSGQAVSLDDDRVLTADLVVDARGPRPLVEMGAAGYQKFVGCELLLKRSVDTATATLMDATVPQEDGFRFFYVLPLAHDRILVEDTRFSDSPELDRAALKAEVLAHAQRIGLDVAEVVRDEEGVLPLPLDGFSVSRARDPLVAGYRGGWFHPTTGYSFPVAARLAWLIAENPRLDDVRWIDACAAQDAQLRFSTLLNRLLFKAMPPAMRWHVFERFYRLPIDTIRRFYAHQTTTADRLRILVGKPPRGISLRSALTEGLLA